MNDIVGQLRDASDGWSGDAVCVSQEVAEAAAIEIERLRVEVARLKAEPRISSFNPNSCM